MPYAFQPERKGVEYDFGLRSDGAMEALWLKLAKNATGATWRTSEAYVDELQNTALAIAGSKRLHELKKSRFLQKTR